MKSDEVKWTVDLNAEERDTGSLKPKALFKLLNEKGSSRDLIKFVPR